jgi:acetyl-CoA synthetase
MLMQYDTEYIKSIDLTSLRIIGCSGEPINYKTWEWYNKHVGKNKLPIIDTYWQTETSSVILSSMAGITNSFPEACAYPMVGIDCIIKNKELYIKNKWPGLAKTILNDHTRFINTYFKDNMYFTGDECYINNNLYYIVGRTDDVIKVSAYRISSFQLERETSKLKNIIECAAIGVEHEIKGNCIYLFIVLKDTEENIETKVKNTIKTNIASYAVPERVIIIKELPKTRTGKIMRKVLKNIAENKLSTIDTSALSNEYVIKDIINSLH